LIGKGLRDAYELKRNICDHAMVRKIDFRNVGMGAHRSAWQEEISTGKSSNHEVEQLRSFYQQAPASEGTTFGCRGSSRSL
jgi:hypothetical protein